MNYKGQLFSELNNVPSITFYLLLDKSLESIFVQITDTTYN
jgi:hypothetical protein